jgi:hypothetical protein
VTAEKDLIYEVKVTLLGIQPPVWRRLHVPATYSFWDLHLAIQDSMGWLNSHLHEFLVVPAARRRSLRIGVPDDNAFPGDEPILPSWDIPITKYLSARRNQAAYNYDFGDDWQHSVLVESVLPALPGTAYPACVDGRRRCPPEDIGGVPGYEQFLTAVRDPNHEEHESYLNWVGGSYDPEAFEAKAVRFDNPEKR